MILVALVSAHPTEAEARVALAKEHGHEAPYRGIWIHPTPDRPLVHVFSTESPDELEDGGWARPASDGSDTR